MLTAEQKAERGRARGRLHYAVKCGLLPKASALACIKCARPARLYHHHKGYAPEFALEVIPLCTWCHGREHTAERPLKERRPPRPNRGIVGTVVAIVRYRGIKRSWFSEQVGISVDDFSLIEEGKQPAPEGYYERCAQLLLLPLEYVKPPDSLLYPEPVEAAS